MSEKAAFHGSGGSSREEGPPEPSLAEQARTLVTRGGTSMLSTMSQKHPGYPFGSLMPYGIDEEGNPLFLISSMAMHTHNLQQEPRCTLLIVQEAASGESLGAGRISIMGDAVLVDSADIDPVRSSYLERNPNARNWVDYGDFAFYRLGVMDVYFVGGFGVMGWLTAEQYQQARPDPLVHDGKEIIAHMNDDHGDALIAVAQHFGETEATEALMTGVDYLGFNLRLATSDGYRSMRVPFITPLSEAADARRAMIEVVKQSRA